MYQFNWQYNNAAMEGQQTFDVPVLPWVPDGTVMSYAVGDVEGSAVVTDRSFKVQAIVSINSDVLVMSCEVDPANIV